MTSMPIANTTSPIPSTTGITSGFFTNRTATSKITPKANAGTQRSAHRSASMSLNLRRWNSIAPKATKMPPLNSSHPVPARNPPTTGYGTNRTRLPSRNVPSARKTTPQSTVTTSVAATTVRKTSGFS